MAFMNAAADSGVKSDMHFRDDRPEEKADNMSGAGGSEADVARADWSDAEVLTATCKWPGMRTNKLFVRPCFLRLRDQLLQHFQSTSEGLLCCQSVWFLSGVVIVVVVAGVSHVDAC